MQLFTLKTFVERTFETLCHLNRIMLRQWAISSTKTACKTKMTVSLKEILLNSIKDQINGAAIRHV